MAVVKFDDRVLGLAEPIRVAAGRPMLESVGKTDYDHTPDGYVGVCDSCGGELGDHEMDAAGLAPTGVLKGIDRSCPAGGRGQSGRLDPDVEWKVEWIVTQLLGNFRSYESRRTLSARTAARRVLSPLMEPSDFWTHVGLVAAFFVVVVAPRLFSPGHTLNSVIYITGAMVVIVVATVARRHTNANASPRS